MSASVETELKSLLGFFGEKADSAEASKPEDFFGLIMSFSSSLQVSYFPDYPIQSLMPLQKAALEVHDAEQKAAPKAPTVSVQRAPETVTDEQVRIQPITATVSDSLQSNTIKKSDVPSQSLRPPAASQGRAGGLSVGRGDLDQAIRSMRTGKRRPRPQRPANKIFMDGTRTSRIFDHD